MNMIMILLFLSALCAAPAGAQHHEDGGFGVVDFSVSCSPGSQAEFNRAMALFHHMTYPQARKAFQEIAGRDTGCAMAWWGVAMTLFQPLWPTRPGPQDLERGWEAVRRAQALGPATKREELLIAAAGGFFHDPDGRDYWSRIEEWAEGMKACYASFPDDHEIAALYALASLATVRPDQVASPNNARAANLLLRILHENPRHPGAMHYLIHANDVPGREHESLEVLRKYEAIAPDNPHALHMPTHIYTRLGEWKEVVRGNIRAAEAALEFPAGDRGQYVWDEFPHAIEYLVYAYLQTGADDDAAAQLKRLRETAMLEPSFKTAFHIASTAARYALERKAWPEAAAITPREPATVDWDRFPWPEAISWFARGLGSARLGDTAEARKSLDRLAALEEGTAGAKEVLFARNIGALRMELAAWLLHAAGMEDSSVAVMTKAATLETSTPKHAVTPGPTLPAHELLGDLLIEQRKPAEALAAYEKSLGLYPGRWNALLGAARASRAAGDLESAAGYYRRLVDASDSGSGREALGEARGFLSR
jgi:tetratricopeptide (TPR) repeat protein